MNRFKYVIDHIYIIKNIIKLSPHDISTNEGKSYERYRRIILTGGSTAIVKIFSVLINLFTVPLTLNYLGAERYGLWMTISSFMTLLSFADLGLGNGLLNAISKANGRGNIKEAQIAVSSTFFMLLCISAIIFVGFILVYPFIDWFTIFNVESSIAVTESGPTMFILIITFLINMPLGIIQRIQEGYQEGYKFQLWLILGSILSFGGLLIAVYLEAGLPWLVLTFSSGQIIATLLNGIYLFTKKRPYIKPKISLFNFQLSKELIKSGVVFFILGLFTLIGSSSDNIIIAHTIGTKYVAGYEVVKKIFMFSMLSQFVIQPLWPAFGEAMASGDIYWAKRTLKKALFFSILSGAILSFPLVIFGKQLISFWVGSEFVPDWSLLIGFYFFIIFANYGGVMSTFLNSGALVARQTMVFGLAAVCSILMKIFFIYSFGVSGVIWATVIAFSFIYIWPIYKMAFNYLNKL